MRISRNDRIRMERAHVHAWPALRARRIDGWLWRSSGGGTQRANSVSTVDFDGEDVEAAIDTVETLYRQAGGALRFQLFDETSPAGLADRLVARGYVGGSDTITMFRPLIGAPSPVGVERRDAPWDEWLDVYLEAITENRRAVNREILRSIPAPCGFFGYRHGGRLISTALGVVAHGCSVIECVATGADARRSGGARAVLAGLTAWAATQQADLQGLQVVAENTGAIRLYESLGFVPGARNRYWVRD